MNLTKRLVAVVGLCVALTPMLMLAGCSKAEETAGGPPPGATSGSMKGAPAGASGGGK